MPRPSNTPLARCLWIRDAIEALLNDGLIRHNDAAHAREHSLEVHLPFVQRVFPRARCVGAALGWRPDFTGVALRVLARLWGGPETIICGLRSDRPHYHDYDTRLSPRS